MEIPESESEALRAIADAAGEDGILTAEELSDVKGIEYAARRDARMALDASKLEQVVYDGVEETEFEMNGCEVNILDFHMTHLGASIRLRVTAPAGMTEEEGMRLAYSVVSPMEDDNGNGYSWCLFRPDGSMLALEEGWSGGAGYGRSPDGRASYEFGLDIDSIIPLEGLEKLVLMPYRMHYDDHDQPVYDYLKDWAVELTPILCPAQSAEPVETLSPEDQAAFDRFMNGEVTTQLERQVAAANWKAGDPTVTVYATERGKYYHVDIDCPGMRNAFSWAIEDAVKDGKQPCPDCVGGPNAPEKVDIMNNELSFPGND